jgi:predicted DNA-binding protein YlxM (UPF0122 family)
MASEHIIIIDTTARVPLTKVFCDPSALLYVKHEYYSVLRLTEEHCCGVGIYMHSDGSIEWNKRGYQVSAEASYTTILNILDTLIDVLQDDNTFYEFKNRSTLVKKFRDDYVKQLRIVLTSKM